MDTKLLHASFDGNLEVVKSQLGKGANIECKDVYGRTPLHKACKRGCLKVITLLLENGANIEAKDFNDWTPLHVAIHGRLELIKFMLGKGANIEAKDFNNWTPLHMAIACSRLEVMELLVEKGVNIESKTLELAYKSCNLEVIRFLEEYIFSKKIQCFFRVILAKSISNRLRLEPRNLFDPEFSDMRKFLLNIDDSRFN